MIWNVDSDILVQTKASVVLFVGMGVHNKGIKASRIKSKIKNQSFSSLIPAHIRRPADRWAACPASADLVC
jgi:hypothetical protein